MDAAAQRKAAGRCFAVFSGEQNYYRARRAVLKNLRANILVAGAESRPHEIDARIATRYTLPMIISFRHKGLEALYRTGSVRGVQAAHASKLNRILAALDAAAAPEELNHPAYKLHALKGGLESFWSIWINGNWRVTFRFVGPDVELVDYQDYH